MYTYKVHTRYSTVETCSLEAIIESVHAWGPLSAVANTLVLYGTINRALQYSSIAMNVYIL